MDDIGWQNFTKLYEQYKLYSDQWNNTFYSFSDFEDAYRWSETEGRMISDQKQAINDEIKKIWDNGKYFTNRLSGYKNFGFDNDDIEMLKKHFVGNSPNKKYVQQAYERYPSSWISSSLLKSKVAVRIDTEHRGYYNKYSNVLALAGDSDKAKLQVAIHEVGHRMEDSVFGLAKFTNLFYEYRTNGEKSESLGIGYDSYELTKKDNFVDPYMGKDYCSKTDHELLSMGYEYMFDPYDPGRFYDMYKKDPEMTEWLVGIITCVGD